jgi:hypothetical protein
VHTIRDGSGAEAEVSLIINRQKEWLGGPSGAVSSQEIAQGDSRCIKVVTADGDLETWTITYVKKAGEGLAGTTHRAEIVRPDGNRSIVAVKSYMISPESKWKAAAVFFIDFIRRLFRGALFSFRWSADAALSAMYADRVIIDLLSLRPDKPKMPRTLATFYDEVSGSYAHILDWVEGFYPPRPALLVEADFCTWLSVESDRRDR